jgi:hypothetical protein
MINFLDETKDFLEKRNKTLDDIIYVQTDEFRIKDIQKFLKSMDFDYDDGFGCQEIPSDLKIIGKDFWLERYEYDGSEWWDFKTTPVPNDIIKDVIISYTNGDCVFTDLTETKDK